MSRYIKRIDGKLPTAKVIRVWRCSGISWGTIRLYRRWVRCFRKDCLRRGKVPEEQLTGDIVGRWAARRDRVRGTRSARSSARSSLQAWSWGLQACGYKVPSWDSPPAPKPALSPLLEAFVRHRRDVCGVAESTIHRDLVTVQEFLRFANLDGRAIAKLQVAEIDRFITACSSRLALKTLTRVVCTLRSFLRFLYSSGRIPRNLAEAVAYPRLRRRDVPPRALPWSDVRRILRAINRKTRAGRRDYALLLTMAAYGLGAGEAQGLTLDSMDWRHRRLHVVRPKTGRQIDLPLLPGVAQTLAAYLRHGRPRHCTTRALFVRMRAPHIGFQSSGAIRHILQKHARAAGISAPFLGSHVLRHSHATRQIDQGASATVVGDILGHRRPESTSVYVRVAMQRLRGMALPVPQ